MRTIKFRAWDKEENEMFGDISILDDTWDMMNEFFKYKDELTFMQYTGLQDKRGKEIYEGDIIETEKSVYNDHGSYCGVEKVKGVVGFGKGRYSLHCRCSNQDLNFGLHYHEIIGNLYEDKHLLEGSGCR